ncbi:MAG: hypothetical protein M9882_00270 [Homoserinimonas sp.]|nr:hypothetical protein [Homoserinimonas sp.]MCW5944528.1 hypothetical protein [Cryobacterium sp.]
MSIGLPAHLAPLVVRRAFTAAQHTFGATLLGVGIMSILVMQGHHVDSNLWIAAVVMLPSFAMLFIADFDRSVLWALGYLLLGGIGIHVSTRILLTDGAQFEAGILLILTTFSVAILMVAGPAKGLVGALLWTLAGFAVAESSRQSARIALGLSPSLDIQIFLISIATLIVIPLISHVHRLHFTAQPGLHRALQNDQIAQLRSRLESRSAAIMHDTVLNHLATISNSPDGALSPKAIAELRKDIDTIINDDWLTEFDTGNISTSAPPWQHGALAGAIRECVAMGLDVRTTGDFSVAKRLSRECEVALSQAVKQCLVNVIRHAGVLEAEVGIYGSETEALVMVVDHGKGFDETETRPDRLGLRGSVKKRIQQVGGSVRIWSSPGAGTSIMIVVPCQATEIDPHVVDHDPNRSGI